MSPSKYIQEAVSNAKDWMKQNRLEHQWPPKVSSPFSIKYWAGTDISPELEDEEASYYQSVIGVLRWAAELGCIDITCEVSMLSSFLAMPQQGHLDQVMHIFAYLEARRNSRMVFDPT
jgi:hypothetical protein